MARKRKGVRRRVDETVFYVVGIEDWDWSYSFGTNESNIRRHDPYLEFRHLAISGHIVEPQTVKADSAALTLLPEIGLNEAERLQDEPRCVGSLSVHDWILRGLLSVPVDALAPVMQMLAADRFRYVVMTGSRLHYRKTLIRRYSIDTKYEDDDSELQPGA